MNLMLLPLFGALAIGIAGFGLMCVAFMLIARQGGWQQAMQSLPQGRWSLARRLMVAGALLGCIFGLTTCVLFLIPGGIPWLRK